MSRQSQDKYAKRQKELARKRKADEKMARRQERKSNPTKESDASVTDQP